MVELFLDVERDIEIGMMAWRERFSSHDERGWGKSLRSAVGASVIKSLEMVWMFLLVSSSRIPT
jgi:hypothetical protein